MSARLWSPTDFVRLGPGWAPAQAPLLQTEGLPRFAVCGSGRIEHLVGGRLRPLDTVFPEVDPGAHLVLGDWADPTWDAPVLVVVLDGDGVVRMVDDSSGELRWTYCNRGVVEYAALTAIHESVRRMKGTGRSLARRLEKTGRAVDPTAFEAANQGYWMEQVDDLLTFGD